MLGLGRLTVYEWRFWVAKLNPNPNPVVEAEADAEAVSDGQSSIQILSLATESK